MRTLFRNTTFAIVLIAAPFGIASAEGLRDTTPQSVESLNLSPEAAVQKGNEVVAHWDYPSSYKLEHSAA